MKMEFAEPEQAAFRSGSQSARKWTERWVADSLYCPSCGNPRVSRFEANRPVADFFCATCAEEFELKSQKGAFGRKVVDGAYRTMLERLAASNNPSLVLLNYDRERLAVTDVSVVPKQFFVSEIIERRKPLAAAAQRAHWVGCNILLNHIPQSGRIQVVSKGEALPKATVLAQWRRTLFLRDERVEARGWLVEVMRCVELIGQREFTLDQAYDFVPHLSGLYPNNRHVKQKIRQQLQVLRDHGYLEFVTRGHYRLA